MKKLLFFVSIAISLFMFGSAAATAQSNLSFETGTNPGGFSTVFAGQPNITGWSVDFGSVDYIGNYWQASNGVRSIDLNGQNQRGQISQEIATTAGWTYKVTFDMSGNPDGLPLSKFMIVGADKKSLSGYTYVIGTNTRANMQWVTNTYHFTAENPITLLSFTSGINGFFGPVLDNINISVETQVCHLDAAGEPEKTVTLSEPEVALHLAHGDLPGPCTAN